MPLMNWSEELDIGVDAMNREHQDILDAMNTIYDNAMAGADGTVLMRQIERLKFVTERHFRDEEAFMQSINYPDFENHKRMHTRLLRDFESHTETARAAGGIPQRAFFDFLRLWLAAHIKNIDRKYADHAHH